MRRFFLWGLCAGLWIGNAVSLYSDEILTNKEVTELVKSGLGEAIIKEKISNSESIFDMSSKALIDLKKNEVPETIIQLMYQESLKTQKKIRSKIASEIQNLAVNNAESRRGAQTYLKKINSAALPQLRDALNSHTPAVREAVAEMLGILGDHESAAALREMLADRERTVRFAAADALYALHDNPALTLAKNSLKMESEPLDGYLHLLGRFQDTASASLISIRLLKAFSPETRAEAAWALGAMQAAAQISVLEEALQHDSETQVKGAAADALGRISHPDSFPKLVAACNNFPAVRADVLTAIGRYPAKFSVPFLISILAQPMKPEERQATMKALRQLTGRDFGNDLPAWKKWLADNQSVLAATDASSAQPAAEVSVSAENPAEAAADNQKNAE